MLSGLSVDSDRRVDHGVTIAPSRGNNIVMPMIPRILKIANTAIVIEALKNVVVKLISWRSSERGSDL
jgi:hypothetical protein